jgi:hypothetical protein
MSQNKKNKKAKIKAENPSILSTNIENEVSALTVSSNNFFDIYSWIDSPTTLPKCELLEKTYTYPKASVFLDTIPPSGYVLLNQNEDSGGIFVHQFVAFASSTTSDTSTSDSRILTKRYESWSYTPNITQSIKSVTFKLKKSGTISNTANGFKFYIYSDNSSNPGSVIATSTSTFNFSSLTDSFADYKFDVVFDLTGLTKYWFVLEIEVYPPTTDNASIFIASKTDTNNNFAYSTDNVSWQKASGRAYFLLEGENTSSISDSTVSFDMLDNPIRIATNFGGTDDESSYEIIGYGGVQYLNKTLDPVSVSEQGVATYPSVASITVGATASTPKQYSIEVKLTPDSDWLSVYKTIADQYSYDFLKYTFKDPVQLSNIRISYRGDYFASSNLGKITISGYDDLSGMASFQASHYSDFRDVTDFPSSDTEGWVSFEEGISTFDWNLTNSSRIWNEKSISSTSPFTKSITFGSKIVSIAGNKIYNFSNSNLSAVFVLSNDVEITCLSEHKGKLYAGTSQGLVYESTSGSSWVHINQPTSSLDPTPISILPVTSLNSYRGSLWIGTRSFSTSKAAIYSWSGSSIDKKKEFTELEISSLTSAYGYLFVGVSGKDGFGDAAIYKFDNRDWSLSLQTDYDQLDVIHYSTVANLLFAAFRTGDIYALSFDSSNNPLAWNRLYETDNVQFYNINDDLTSGFAWFTADKESIAYKYSDKSFSSISYPDTNNNGVDVLYRSSNIDSYKYFDSYIYKSNEFASDINFTNLDTNSLSATSYYNVTIEGFLKSDNSDSYDFNLATNIGVRIYFDDTLVADSWTNKTSVANITFSNSMSSTKFVKIKIIGFVDTVSTPSIVLSWKLSSGSTYSVIPTNNLFRRNSMSDIVRFSTSNYSSSKDGYFYEFNSSSVTGNSKEVFVRLKDIAGNYHSSNPLLVNLNNNQYEKNIYIYDNIKIGNATVTSGNTVTTISQGKIYQVGKDKNLKATFVSKDMSPLYAPDRKISATGTYTTEPFYISTLTRWDDLVIYTTTPAGIPLDSGLTYGTEVKIYLKSADSENALLSSDWGDPFTYGTIGNSANSGVHIGTYDISTVVGKWMQFKAELVSSSPNSTPILRGVSFSYVAANSSYFFTKLFDTSLESTSVVSPEFRRGLLTSNEIPNGGRIVYGYTTNDDSVASFDFNRYTLIEPNKVFEISEPASKIRFGILFVSVGLTPAIVNDFAVQLDVGEEDLKFMD